MNAHSFIGLSGIGLASADGFLYLLGGGICFRDIYVVWALYRENMNFVHSLSVHAGNRTHAHTRAHTQEMLLSRKILQLKLRWALMIRR